MLQLPVPVRDYINILVIETRSPAYFLVAKDGRLSNWGGECSVYGINNLRQGEYITKQVFFLEGLLPLDQSPIFLPCVKTNENVFADVHLFFGNEGDWVLLLDATIEEKHRSLMQQKGNDLSLLRQKQSTILNQYLGDNISENLAQEVLNLQVQGERRDVTILFADVRGFTNYSENNPPDIVFKTLNLYLSTMIQPILDEAGMVDKIVGDAVMALFGVLPSTALPQTQAIKAAIRIIESVRDIAQVQKADNLPALDIGIGIASGSVALGMIGSKDSKTFSAVGYHVNLALALENQARPNEIIIDENTFNKIDDLQKLFSLNTFLDKNIAPVQIYFYLML